MPKSIRLMLMVIFASAALLAQKSEPLSSIAGTVQGPDGKPVISATVSYLRMAPLNTSDPKSRTTATTTATGAFTLDGLGSGTYMICVNTPASAGILDPCVWSSTPTIVNLTSGQNLKGQIVPVQKSAILQIQVADPTGALSANEGKIANSHFILGVSSPKHIFINAVVSSLAATARTYQVVVPTGTPLNLTMNTSRYRVQDTLGALLGSGRVRPNLTIPDGTPKQTVGLTIVGTTSK